MKRIYHVTLFSIFCLFFFLSSRGYEEASEYFLEQEDLMTDCDGKKPSEIFSNKRYFSLDGDIPGLTRPAVRVLFQRYLHGLLNSNIPVILSVTAESLDFPYYSSSMNKDMQYEFFSELFATYSFSEIPVESMYCVSSGKITLFDGDRAMLTVRARKNPPEALKNWHYWEDFWGLNHYYFFEKINTQWKLIAFDIEERESVL